MVFGDLQDVGLVRDAEHLFGYCVIGDVQFVDEIETDVVNVKVVVHNELAVDFFLVLVFL